jgi:hypothetical protein
MGRPAAPRFGGIGATDHAAARVAAAIGLSRRLGDMVLLELEVEGERGPLGPAAAPL